MNTIKIINKKIDAPTRNYDAYFKEQYTFTKTGRNVLLIMLDRAISGYVPYIFAEKPELLNSFEGFVYYPNTVSFGGFTIYGLTSIFGGYYYTPLEIQKRGKELWSEKYSESMLVLPVIMSESGFNVSIHNQPWMNNKNYEKYSNITAGNTSGHYTDYYHRFHDFAFLDYYKVLFSNLIRFSFF
jgi:hypothetical protein